MTSHHADLVIHIVIPLSYTDDPLTSFLRCCFSASIKFVNFPALVIWRIMSEQHLPFDVIVSLVNSPLTEVEDEDLIDELVSS